jgi:hypothetical protein
LHLTEVALAAEMELRPALETRLKALEGLRAKSKKATSVGGSITTSGGSKKSWAKAQPTVTL